MQIAETVTVQQAAEYLKRARMLLPSPEGDAGEIAALLQLHLAGALLIDDVLGTGSASRRGADQCSPKPGLADRESVRQPSNPWAGNRASIP